MPTIEIPAEFEELNRLDFALSQPILSGEDDGAALKGWRGLNRALNILKAKSLQIVDAYNPSSPDGVCYATTSATYEEFYEHSIWLPAHHTDIAVTANLEDGDLRVREGGATSSSGPVTGRDYSEFTFALAGSGWRTIILGFKRNAGVASAILYRYAIAVSGIDVGDFGWL